MIFVDTGAIYALIDKNDTHHTAARDFYSMHTGSGAFHVSYPVITETCMLLEIRLGNYYARKFWQSLLDEVFKIIPLQISELERALYIEYHYADACFGFVDATSMALIESGKIQKIFTFDRKHFLIFKPSVSKGIELLP